MGERGPAPRREAEVRRTNNKGKAEQLGPDELQELPFEVDFRPNPLDPQADWNQLIKDFWEDLKRDPARSWMTSADWGATRIVLQLLSDAMNGEDGVNGQQQSAFLKHLASIGVTENARMRMQKEVTLFPRTPVDETGNVRDINSARREEVQ